MTKYITLSCPDWDKPKKVLKESALALLKRQKHPAYLSRGGKVKYKIVATKRRDDKEASNEAEERGFSGKSEAASS